MLTEKQIDELGKIFKFNEHGFFTKKPYILKSAIRARLNRIAPGWRLLPPELLTVTEDVVVMRGGIQIGDIVRYGIGTGQILRADSNGEIFSGKKLTQEIAKAFKAAGSDILPRAALEFGMGEYLKNKPKDINETNFEGWLNSLLPADPNAWTTENIRAWGNKHRLAGLTDADLMKALNITDRWTSFKGTVSDADKAVEAYRNVQSAFGAPASVQSH